MKIAQHIDFIRQNVAPKNVAKIGLYNSMGKLVGKFDLQNLKFPNVGEKLYSFGALSDIHVSQDTAEADFRRALTYFQDTEKVDFVCVAGDLGQHNMGQHPEEWALYSQCVAEESENTPVYPISGNHDANGLMLNGGAFLQYTGHDTFYTFIQGNDVFIMLSSTNYPSHSNSIEPFDIDDLKDLQATLEANRNKRCFVFQHYFPWGKAGDPLEIYGSNSAFWGNQGQVIYSLMEHYKNALWFHGHSHQCFEAQAIHKKATYDFDFGCHNIHIPSCYAPMQITESGSRIPVISGSQGYVIDVYENGIHLRGRDFIKGEFLPIASYWLDTTLQTIPAGTYTDSTGTITT